MAYIKKVSVEYTDGDVVALEFDSQDDSGFVDFSDVAHDTVWGPLSLTLFAALLQLAYADNQID